MEGATLKKETIETKHEEFIHDVAFDFYGDRVATCSSDFSICIFGSSDGGDKTKLSGHIKSHEGPVWRIRWADPIFGPLLVTCSADKTIKFFSEETNIPGVDSRWNVEHTFTQLKECSDIKFAPKRFGFKLAAVQRDAPGQLIVFAPGSRTNLDTCSIKAQIKVSDFGSNCLDWEPEGIDNGEMIVVGSNTETDEQLGRKPLPINENEKTEEVTGEELRIFGISGAKITPIINLHSPKGHNGSIKDVAWAPQNGKTYHTIASCADDSKVIIWRFDTGNDEGNFGSK